MEINDLDEGWALSRATTNSPPELVPRQRMAPELELQIRELLAQLTLMISDALPNVRTEEIRQFINKHKDIGDFKSLALTLILLAECQPKGDEDLL